jgi:hypothetical protein
MSTGLIAGGSLAGIIIARLIVFEKLGNAIDFSIPSNGGEPEYRLRAIWAFTAMAIALLVVALRSRRPVIDESAKPDQPLFDEIDARPT